MRQFQHFYQFLEKSFFQTLSRKLAGNLLFLLLLPSALLASLYFGLSRVETILLETDLSASIIAQVRSVHHDMWVHALLVYSLIIAGFVFTFFFLWYLMIRPVRKIRDFFGNMGGRDGDLTAQISSITFDEFKELAENGNRFLNKLRKTILSVRKMGIHIAVNSVKLTQNVEHASNTANQQNLLANDIFVSSEQSKSAHLDISDKTQQVCSSTSNSLELARESFDELQQANDGINTMNEKINSYAQTIQTLNAESQEIQDIVALIKSISFQTSLLSLNAAVEAARAGQAGKGFAVVADEVKKLAAQVNKASEDIEIKVQSILAHVQASLTETQEIQSFAKKTGVAVNGSCSSFSRLIGDFEQNDNRLQAITAATEQLSAANEEIHGKVTAIYSGSQGVVSLMTTAETSSQQLTDTTEDLQALVAGFRVGAGNLEMIIDTAKKYRASFVKKLTDLHNDGINIFDRNYILIPEVTPAKYHTSYDKMIEQDFKRFSDQLVQDVKGGTFALCVDENGYAPTHNSKFSQPLTGNQDIDIKISRDKRIFDDTTGIKAARNQRDVLLQTYMRDTGEILCDLSLPLSVKGKHWGALRVGFDPQSL